MRLLTFSLLLVSSLAYKFEDCQRIPAALSKKHSVGGKLYSYNLDFYHQKALPYSAIYAFTDVFLQINLTNADLYQFYQGSNCTTVQQLYDNDNRYFGLWRKAALLRSHQLNPFNDTVVGVSTTEPYEISVLIWKINYVRVAVFAGAILLFLLASKLVRNVVFYYTSGCSFGILASLLLVAFIVWRVAPKKTIGLPILIGGWSVSLYMLHFAWSNLQSILLEYQKYVIAYFSVVLLISMAFCYKRGPPTDARSHDIAQWTLQLVALLLIYFSVQIVEISSATIVLLVFQQISRGFLMSGCRILADFWRFLFPTARKLLNEEEYDEIGRKTTKEQLAILRDYCRQEKNRPWKLAGNVRSARRLARFVEGDDDHITEDEIYAHEITGDVLDRENFDFDEDFDDFDENGELRTPNGTRHDLEEDEQNEDEEWDEIMIRRPSNGRSSVQSVRVPRSVSSRLFSPYQNRMNQSMGPSVGYRRETTYRAPAMSSYYSEHRPRVQRAFDSRSGRIDPPIARYSTSSSSGSSMTPSEYMRRARRIEGTSKTPTRRSSSRYTADSEVADE